MRRPSSRTLALLLPAAFLMATLARAQDRSHEIDPDLLTSPKNASKLLDPKRLKGKSPIDIDMMQRLLKTFGNNIDPKDVDQRMIDEFLRDNPEFKDPQNLEKLRDLAEQQKREPRNRNDQQPPVDWDGVQNQLKRIDEARKKPIDPRDPRLPVDIDRPPFKQDPPRPQTNTPRPKKEKEEKESKDFSRWLTKNFGNSPEMGKMGRDFDKIFNGDKKNGGGFLKDIEKEWKGLGGSTGKGGDSNLKDFANKLKLPNSGSNSGGGSGKSSSSNNSSGGSGGGSGSGPPPSTSSSGGGWSFGGGGGGGSWTPVVVLLVVGVGGFLFYLYYVRHRKPVEEAPIEQARVWPVDPLQVNSREDVVKAFEFLSISKCGDEAVNWHHLQIANQMGVKEPGNKDAADRLARLYEKARYAPANELFDDMDIAEARARFSQLAGAPSA